MNQPAIILLVDDVETNRDTLRELLDAPDFHLVEAADGPAALRLAAATPPDLVLLDVMMPGMDGFEVCRRLRSNAALAEVPVIMLTALSDERSRITGIEAGADDFITKPFNGSELRARARTITRLNRYRRLHETLAALQESEKHFRTLFELGPIAIYTCDRLGMIRDYNRHAVKLWGWEPKPGKAYERYCGSPKLFRSDGTFLPHDQCPMAQVVNGEIAEGKDLEVVIERKDKSRINVIVNIAPLRNADGEITGAINCFHDITARKAAELELRASEEWLKAIFDQSAVGVVEADARSRRFLRFNQRFCDILGYSRREMGERTHFDITHEHDLHLDSEYFEKLRAGVIREYTREKRYIRKDGEIVWASVAVTRVGQPDAEATAFISVVLDITERKRIDDHFLQAQKMEALGQFSGGVAHDFNNILAAIGGYTELSLMALKENPGVRSHLGSVLKAAGRAADLVRQILTFSRQEPQRREAILLQPVIEESLKLMRATIPSTVEFVTSIEADAPPVLANGNQIHQILMNLGINAWHSMKETPGIIEVKLNKLVVSPEYAATKPRLRAGAYVCVSVSDSGSGMDPVTLRRIFEPFFTTKKPGEGTGLGLSVVHGIMDSHDGAVTVHSQVGVGTIFRLYFPVHGGEIAPPLVENRSLVKGNGQRILVVDDEDILASMMQKMLTNLGYVVESSTDPAVALELIRTDPARFALVISDQTMPVITGLDLANRIRKIGATMPILLMTGYSLSLTAERIEEAGIRQLLLKPIAAQSLATAVDAALFDKLPTSYDSNSPYRR